MESLHFARSAAKSPVSIRLDGTPVLISASRTFAMRCLAQGGVVLVGAAEEVRGAVDAQANTGVLLRIGRDVRDLHHLGGCAGPPCRTRRRCRGARPSSTPARPGSTSRSRPGRPVMPAGPWGPVMPVGPCGPVAPRGPVQAIANSAIAESTSDRFMRATLGWRLERAALRGRRGTKTGVRAHRRPREARARRRSRPRCSGCS